MISPINSAPKIAMHLHLGITPSGSLTLLPADSVSGSFAAPDAAAVESVEKIHKVFNRQGELPALFALAARRNAVLPPAYNFWKIFTSRWLRERCALTATEAESTPLPPLSSEHTKSLVESAPPMPGAEYLSGECLQQKWEALDAWLLGQLESISFSDYLQKHAPEWHVAGQLYFHLAENPQDENLPFAFIATWQPQGPENQGKHLPLGRALEIYSGKQQKALLRELLEPVQLAAESSPFVAGLIENKVIYRPQAWSAPQAWQFLQEVPLLKNCGVIVRLPDWWQKRPRPLVKASMRTAEESMFGADQLLNFDISVVLDGKKLTQREWQRLMKSETGLVRLKGKWVEVDAEKLAQAMDQMQALAANAHGVGFVEGMRLLAGATADLRQNDKNLESEAWRFIEADGKLAETLKKMRQPGELKTALPGAALKATLRPYQQTGARWLWHLNQLGLGACLADDMGLGKTIQVIALILMLKKKRVDMPCILVVPTSLLGNWKAEVEKFAPSLKAVFVHRAMTALEELKTLKKSGLAGSDIVLTSYGTLPRQKWLLDIQWHTAILDEAQAIKNAGTTQSKTVKKLKSRARIALTGTPVENRLSDLWSLFDFINPGLLGSVKEFANFAKSLEQRSTEQYAPLRKLVQPYILRRLKTDKRVIDDLPDKTELTAWCGLSSRQAVMYQSAVEEMAERLDTVDGIQRRGVVLSFMMRFKQICNHPSQVLGDGGYDLADSGKLQRLSELCDEINARQEKVLVFTQFRELCQPLQRFLTERFSRKGLMLHGGTQPKRRQQLVAEFQADNGPPFFVISLKAGGTGLNLTAASHVIHFDRWWNPAVENQATDRAYRIGQQRNVLVHKFVCRGTIEERVDEMIRQKSSMAEELLSGGAESKLTELNDSELLKLVSLNLKTASAEAVS
jgi:non-specific serine/threonine protein kinase